MTRRTDVDMTRFVRPVELDPTPYLDESPLLAEVISRQRDLHQQPFDSIVSAYHAGRALCNELDKLAVEAGLMRQPVVLTGTELFIPTAFINTQTGTEHLDTSVKQSDPLDPGSVRGIFCGFGTSVIQKSGEPGSNEGTTLDANGLSSQPAYASIHYQVQISGPTNLLNIVCGLPCAHAAVDASTLEFVDDKRRREAASALAALTSLPFPQAQFFAHNLDSLLEPDDHRYYVLRSLGRMVRLFVSQHENKIAEQHKDAILDFLQARLGLYPEQQIAVAADYAVSVPKKSDQLSMVTGANLTANVCDLSFAPHSFYGATQKARRGQWAKPELFASSVPTAPAIVLPWHDRRTDEDTYLRVPFEYMRRLEPEEIER